MKRFFEMKTAGLAAVAATLGFLSVAGYAQQVSAPKTAPAKQSSVALPKLPKAPLDKNAAPLLGTASGQTHPELGHQPAPSGLPQEGQVLGSQGWAHQSPSIEPFGSKGEKVGLSFLAGDFVPPTGQKLQPSLAQLTHLAGRGASNNSPSSVYTFIVLNGRLDDTLKTKLTALGVKLFDFYPYSAYQAQIPTSALNEVAALDQVNWVGQPDVQYKLEPSLFAFAGAPTTQTRELFVNLFGSDDDGSLRQQLAALGATVKEYYPSLRMAHVQASPAVLSQILNQNAVLFVEPEPQNAPFDMQSMSTIDADYLWGSNDGRPTGNSSSIKLGLVDSGINIYHQEFGNIIGGTAGYDLTDDGSDPWTDFVGHGTYVGGIMMAEGAYYPMRGVAAGIGNTGVAGYDFFVAKVFKPGASSPGSWSMNGFTAMDGGYNASYKRQLFNYSGGSTDGNLNRVGTDDSSRQIDNIFADNVLPVIAAGNDGSGASTIASPGCAKGAFTVGAIYDDGYGQTDGIAGYSSRGPTGDSRIKPDVVAPGSWIDSSTSAGNNTYGYGGSGTSYATPHVTGLAAGLIAHYGAIPAWATRSIITANTIQTTGLNSNDGGRGKVDAWMANYNTDGFWQSWWSANGGTGDLQTRDFSLDHTYALVRVILVYPDPAAASGAAKSLVNDLDLYVQYGALTTDHNGQWYDVSSHDNVAEVDINNAPAGNYRIKIYTYAQNSGGSQAWAVTLKGVSGSLYPNINFNLSAPVAVQPNSDFTVDAQNYDNSYVASGVYTYLNSLGGPVSLNGSIQYRPNGAGGEENVYYGGNNGMNEGSIPAGFTRHSGWSLHSGSEGTATVGYALTSVNGGSGSTSRTVLVDGTPPGNWSNFIPATWTNSWTPDCWIQVQDTFSGLNTSGIYYWWSIDGHATYNGAYAASTSAANGSTSLEWIEAPAVPFNQDDGSGLNQVYFRAYDRAGNYSDSGWEVVKIDTVAPGDWQNFTPGGATASLTPTCTVQAHDVLSGLNNTANPYFNYSTDGGATWAGWQTCSMTGADGSNSFETLSATVPFNQVSSTNNLVQFAVSDLAGNWGYSGAYTVNVVTAATNIQGVISLDGVASPAGFTAKIVVTEGGSTETFTPVLTASGAYSVDSTLTGDGTVSATIVNGTWLRQRQNVTLGGPITADFNLLNGDVNQDNAVDDFDLTDVIVDFNGTPNVNGHSDVTWDGIVDDFDLTLVIIRFGSTGDPE